MPYRNLQGKNNRSRQSMLNSNSDVQIMNHLRKESVKVLKDHNNLDLETYKPFMNDFHRFLGELFDFENNIFQTKKTDMDSVSRLKRCSKNEYKYQESALKVKEGDNTDLSPERINKILKKMPPFKADNLSDDFIKRF